MNQPANRLDFKAYSKQSNHRLIWQYMEKEKSKDSVFEQEILGIRKFSSADEFRKALGNSPDDPWLYRLLAMHHKNHERFAESRNAYLKSYHLFLEEGKSLQGIASLIRGWSIAPPTPHDFRVLHSQLRRKNSHSSAIAECLTKMSYRELVALLLKSALINFPANKVVCKSGEVDEALYFVVYGNLLATSPDDNGPQDGDNARQLSANDFFGYRQPGSAEKSFSGLVKTVTRVELLKFSKEDLLTLCGEDPDLQIGLETLLHESPLAIKENPPSFSRKSSRSKLNVTLMLEIFAREPGKHPALVKCLASDISLGGMCVIVDPRYRDLPSKDMIDRKIRAVLSLPDESVSLSILGRLAWYKEADLEGEDTYSIGIQFNEMPPRLRGLLIVFANAVGSLSLQMSAGVD